jgi:hypothetical protein
MAAVVAFAPARARLAVAAPNALGATELLGYPWELESKSLVAIVIVDLAYGQVCTVPEWAGTLIAELKHRTPLLDVIVLRGGRWWSHLCLDQHCCPPHGRPLRPWEASADLIRPGDENPGSGAADEYAAHDR